MGEIIELYKRAKIVRRGVPLPLAGIVFIKSMNDSKLMPN